MRLPSSRPAWSSAISNSLTRDDRGVVAGYNRDDCLSTLRVARLAGGTTRVADRKRPDESPRPAIPEGEPSEKLDDWQRKVNALSSALTEGVPADVVEQTAEQHARWLLAYLLDWHRREEKALWWEYFRLRDLAADELLDERAACRV